jgi:hypothetical protein
MLGVFLLFIYLLMIYFLTHHVRAPHFTHEMFPWNGPLPCLAHLWIHRLSLLLTPCFRNANALVGLTHRDHGKQACHHKKVADRQILHYLLTIQGPPTFSQKRRQTKGIKFIAPTIPVVPYFNPTSFALSSSLFVTLHKSRRLQHIYFGMSEA